MIWLRRIGSVLVASIAVAVVGLWVYGRRSLPRVDGDVAIAGLDGPVDVVRDAWGVPHIFAATDHDAYMALGYAHAQDRLWQMEWQRRIGAGRLSEVVGIDALDSDKFLRTLGVRAAAEAMQERLSADAQSALDAYAAGVNAFLAEGNPLPPEFSILGVTPEPWTVADSLSWIKMMSWNLAGNYDLELLRARLVQAVGVDGADALMPGAPDGPDVVGARSPAHGPARAGATGRPNDLRAVHAVVGDRLDRMVRLTSALDARIGARGPDIGSNSWVVGGAHTATGAPILANDPHLGAQIPSQWYLAELNGDTLHATGATLPGLPVVVIGRNARIAWGLTNFSADVQDIFVERVEPDDRNRVAVPGGWEAMTAVDSPIRVKGRSEPVPWTARRTRHGPVISDVIDEQATAAVSEGASTALALRWTALDADDTTVDAFLGLNHAHNWDDFLQAMRSWVSPCQNVVYADVDGHIGYIAPCRIPIRAAGDGTLPVPGWDDAHEWRGEIPFDDLPRVEDPARGYIVTANQNVLPADYPYVVGRNWAQPYRAERIAALLRDRIDTARPLTALDMMPIQGDQASLYMREVLPRLRAIDPEGDEDRAKAIELLADWDGTMQRDSAAAAIAQAWLLHIGRQLLVDDLPVALIADYLPNENLQQQPRRFVADVLSSPSSPWCDDSRTSTQESCDDLARRALDSALNDLRGSLGGQMASWRWGAVHAATFAHAPLGDVPLLGALFNRHIANGGDAFTIDAAPPNVTKPYRQDKVPGYRQIVTLRDNDVGRFSIATGQSGHPLASHYADRLRAHRDIEYVPMTLGRDNTSGSVLHLAPSAAAVPQPANGATSAAVP
ncbi:MAG: penicillin acylase family protein [Ardenticatenales bacterium]